MRIKNLLNKANINKTILIGILFIFLTFIYFSFVVTVSQDSTGYYKYLDILNGKLSFQNWDIIRGPMMPIFLFIIFKLFGNSVFGFLIGTYIFYLILIYFLYKVIKIVAKNRDGIINNIIWILFIVLVVFNPLIIGYYHAMLTEFIVTTFVAITCYVSIKWINVKNRSNDFYIYLLSFMFLSGFMWLLKQPYFFAILILLVISTFLSLIKNKSISNLLIKTLSIIVVFIFTFLSIKIWNHILTINGVKSTDEQSASFISNGLASGISYFRREAVADSKSINKTIGELNKVLEPDQQLPLVDNSDSTFSWIIYSIRVNDGQSVKGFWVLKVKNAKNFSMSETLELFKYVTKKFPSVLIDSYVANYLATINIYQSIPTEYGFFPLKKISDYNHENDFFGLMQYKFKETYWWGYFPYDENNENMVYSNENISQFEKVNKPNIVAQTYANLTSKTSLWLFRIVFILAPTIGLFVLVKYIEDLFKRKNKHLQNTSEIIIILYSFAFLYAVFFSLIGANIDRYIFPAYPTAIVATILLIKYFYMYKNGDVDEKEN